MNQRKKASKMEAENKKAWLSIPPLKIPGPHPLLYPLTCIFLPLVILVGLAFLIFKQFVRIFLIIKHGRKFGGFYASADGVWWVQEKTSSNIMPLLFIIKSKQQCDMVEKVKRRFNENIFNTKDYPKLTSTCNFCCGYPYIILDQYTLNECIHELKTPDDGQTFDERYLTEVVSKTGNSEFHKRDATWEVFVTNRHLDLTKNGYHYPMIIKIHHAVADGVAMVTFLSRLLGDSVSNQYIEKVLKKYVVNSDGNERTIDDLRKHVKKVLQLTVETLYLLYIGFGRMCWILFLRKRDKSVLHGVELSGQKIAVVSWEHKQELVPLVKEIKNRVPNCAFSDVIYTALSSSYTEFFKKNDHSIPMHISGIIPIILSYREISKPGPVKLVNKFSITYLNMPTKQGSFCETLKRVQEENLIMKNLPEVKLNYWLLNYLVGVLPLPVFKKTMQLNGLTQAISNIPGTERIVVLNDCELENVTCFAPHRWKTGLGVTFITYDNRFQVGLIVDRALIPSREEAQNIADNILKNIRKIDKETKIKYNILGTQKIS